MLMRGWKFDSIRNGLSPFAMSHFEIGSDKRISRHLSGETVPAHLQNLVSGYATYQDLSRFVL